MNNQQVEITVLVELFSTFFDKITVSHPERDTMIKDLSQFKESLYQHQDNLDQVYSFLDILKRQKQLSS